MPAQSARAQAKRLATLAVVALALSILIAAEANVTVYNPANVTVRPVDPPVWYLPPLSTADASIAANGTEANVTAVMTADQAQIIDNPGFDNSADPWLCYTNYTYVLCYYLDQDSTTGDTGIISFYGTVASGDSGITFLRQTFTVPTTVYSFDIAVRYRLASTLPVWFYRELTIRIYDLNNSVEVASTSVTLSYSTSYIWLNKTFNVQLDPGITYAYDIVFFYDNGFWRSRTVDLRVDYANIFTSDLAEPAFFGELVRVNVTQNVTGRLVIESYEVSGVTGQILLEGANGTTSITLDGATLLQTQTGWVEINLTGTNLYVPARVLADVAGPAGSWAVLEGYLEYRVGGVSVRLPLRINITS